MSDNPITLLLPLDGDLTGHVSADSDDDITATGSGAVRYEDGYASGTQAALLEAGGTNLHPNPTALGTGTTVWAHEGLSVANQGYKTGVTATPNGTTTAFGLDWTASSSWGARAYDNQSSPMAASPNTAYTVQMLVYATSAITISGDVILRDGSNADTQVVVLPDTAIPATTWTRVALTFTTDADVASLRRWGIRSSAAAGNPSAGTLWITDAQIEQGDAATTFIPQFDGASLDTGYAWTGTAHDSASTRAAASITADNSYLDPERGSLAFRFYRERDTGGVETILTCGTDGSGTDHLTLRIAADDTLEMAWTADGAAETVTATTGTIPTEEWVYITADWDGTVTHLGVDLTETVTGTRDTPEGSWGAGDLTLEAT